jgi:ABC-2 type transport system permease protein
LAIPWDLGGSRGIFILWHRELIRFRSDRARAISSLTTFPYPGVIILPVLLTSIPGGGITRQDREFGFLHEMLAAPMSTYAIIIGKWLDGATVAMLPGILALFLAGLAHVPYSLPMLLTMVGELFLL